MGTVVSSCTSCLQGRIPCRPFWSCRRTLQSMTRMCIAGCRSETCRDCDCNSDGMLKCMSADLRIALVCLQRGCHGTCVYTQTSIGPPWSYYHGQCCLQDLGCGVCFGGSCEMLVAPAIKLQVRDGWKPYSIVSPDNHPGFLTGTMPAQVLTQQAN